MTLSIFSFDKVRAAIRLPLRTHLWHCWLILTLVGLMMWASIALSKRDTSSPLARRSYPNLEQKEIALIGDSQMASIRENTLAFPAKNFSGGGTAYPIQCALLKHFAPQMPKLRTVLIGFNNILLRNPDIERRKGDYRTIVALGLPWYRIPASWRDRIEYFISYQYYLKPLLVGPRPAIRDLAEWPFLKKIHAAEQISNEEARASLDVFQVNTIFTYAPIGGAGKVRGYMNLYNDEKTEQINRRAFFGILDYCSKNGLETVLLRNPTTQGYRAARSQEWDQALVDLLVESRAKFPSLSLPVWDAERTEYFPLELFSDPNHMWPDGTALFADYISARLQERPYRDDSNGLEYAPGTNHLFVTDPREDLWIGPKENGELIARTPIPPGFEDKFREAFQITLPPGEQLRQSDLKPVLPGDQSTAGLWLWSNDAIDTPGLRLIVIRDGSGPIAGESLDVLKLDQRPRLYTVAHTFTQAQEGTRLQILNRSERPITFIMAGPSIMRQ